MKTYSVKQVLKVDSSIERIKKIVSAQPEFTRNDLARFLCDEFDFRDMRGKFQLSACLKSLRELNEKGLIPLPEPRHACNKKWAPRRLGHDVPLPANLPVRVDQIKDIRLIVVEASNRPLMEIHNELLCSEHPLGDKRIVGRQLRYLISSEHGWLGTISFSSSALYLEDRDKWIGWEKEYITRNRDYVINMSRFLIRNAVQCKNLASFVLAKCIKQVPEDYEKKFGYRPLLIESFVDTQSYEGTCYKAANWIHVGQTKGRGREDRYSRSDKSIKKIFLYPLVDDFRTRMGLPEQSLLKEIAPTNGIYQEEWANFEFGGADLGDERLNKRLIQIAGNKNLRPGASYLQAAKGDRYASKAFYQFLENERQNISFASILQPHRDRTMQRMKYNDCVLVIQDTSELNYSHLRHCEGLGFLGTNQTNTINKGLKLHSSFAVSEKGVPLGILKADCYAPDPSKVKKKKSEKRNTPISEKESYRWLDGYKECLAASKPMPATQIINVMDREADIYELFELAEQTDNCVDLLIRAQHNRRLVANELKLFEQLSQSPVRLRYQVDIPSQRKRINKKNGKLRPYVPARKAILAVRYEKVCLKPPESPILKNRPEITLYAVYAVEENPPKGSETISWFLITTLKVNSAVMAKKCIEFYRRRWLIEEWHRVLKTGLGIEKYKNKSAERIKRILAIDMVIGWRAMLLTIYSRENPEAPAEELFSEVECKIFSNIIEKKTHNAGCRLCVVKIRRLSGQRE